jgi:hypothetical protein
MGLRVECSGFPEQADILKPNSFSGNLSHLFSQHENYLAKAQRRKEKDTIALCVSAPLRET